MQAYEVKIMPQADEELEDIAYFIALDSPQTSQRFVNELITAFTKILGYFPESGSVYPEVLLQRLHCLLSDQRVEKTG